MVENTRGDVEVPYKNDNLDERAYVQAVMDIHFDEDYGTPYWLEHANRLDFDPREEIDSFQDLSKLGVADEEALVERPVEDFMPRLFSRNLEEADNYSELVPDPSAYDMSKSSGSTGKKKVMPWRKHLSDEVSDWYNFNFELRDIDGGNWLIAGPPGLYEKQTRSAAEKRGGFPLFSGIETRRLKPQLKQLGRLSEEPYSFLKDSVTEPGNIKEALEGLVRMKYTLRAMEEDLQSEEVGVIASAPEPVERVHGMLESDDARSTPEDVNALLMSGMGTTQETVDRLEQKYPNAEAIPMYATSFTGANFDNPKSDDFEYHSIHPFISFDVVESEETGLGDTVDYGERGQVVLNHLSSGFLWPNQTERETAERRFPAELFGGGDGIADIRPLSD